MSIRVDPRVEFFATRVVTDEVSTLTAVRDAYNQALTDATQANRTPVMVEVTIRVAPKEN